MSTLVVRIVRADQSVEERRFRGLAVLVGSDEACDLVLDGEGVALYHLEIQPAGKGFILCDAGSEQGTFIGGTRLTAGEPYRLREGERVRVGEVDLELERVLDVEVLEFVEEPSSPRRVPSELAWSSWTGGGMDGESGTGSKVRSRPRALSREPDRSFLAQSRSAGGAASDAPIESSWPSFIKVLQVVGAATFLTAVVIAVVLALL